MTSLCRHVSAQEIVYWVTTADGCVHTADATVASRRRYVLGITLTEWLEGRLRLLTSSGAKAQQTPPPCCNKVVPWSLHIFPENFMQIGPAVFS